MAALAGLSATDGVALPSPELWVTKVCYTESEGFYTYSVWYQFKVDADGGAVLFSAYAADGNLVATQWPTRVTLLYPKSAGSGTASIILGPGPSVVSTISNVDGALAKRPKSGWKACR